MVAGDAIGAQYFCGKLVMEILVIKLEEFYSKLKICKQVREGFLLSTLILS